MAETSSHLRNFAVAELIGLIGMLDGHPQLRGKPIIKRVGASIQQRSGTAANPFAHVAPSSLLLNGKEVTSFFTSPAAKSMVTRVFSMGVMAPDDWADANEFPINPAQQNIADNIGESFKTDGGLVAASEKNLSEVAAAGTWNGSGKRQQNAETLEKLIGEYYKRFWKPLASLAYERALSHLNTRLMAATKSQQQSAQKKAHQRIAIVKAQKEVLGRGTIETQVVFRSLLISGLQG